MKSIGNKILTDQFGQGPSCLSRGAPGRINIIGEHTDYNNGLVLPFAISRRTNVAIRPRTDNAVQIFARELDDVAKWDLPVSSAEQSGNWSDYVRGVVYELSLRAEMEHGFDMATWSDLPVGIGLSSSAALEIATGLSVAALYNLEIDSAELAKICQCAEIHFVGTRCGIMDQYASLFCREGFALLLDVANEEHKLVPLNLAGVAFIAIDSGVKRTLSASGYNDRHAECRQAVSWLNDNLEGCKASYLREVTHDDLRKVAGIMPRKLQLRAKHVVEENGRVLKAVFALEHNDSVALGKLLVESHVSLREQFEVSTPELDFLVECGLEHGALGARLVGGGFGGMTLHLIPSRIREDYVQDIKQEYRNSLDKDAIAYAVNPSKGALELVEEKLA